MRLANLLLKRFCNAITEDEILKQRSDGRFELGGRIATNEDMASIIGMAKSVYGSYGWKLLKKELEYEANKKGVRYANSSEDLYFAKALLFMIYVFDKKLEKLSNLK